jgi:Mobilization protein NikA
MAQNRDRSTDHRTVLKSVRFTPGEWEEVLGRAGEVGVSPARFLRLAALGVRLGGRADAEAVRQLARVGNNLNQIARTGNAIGRVELTRRVAEVLAEVEAAVGRLV